MTKYKYTLLLEIALIAFFIHLDPFQNLDSCWFDRYNRSKEIDFFTADVLLASTFGLILVATIMAIINNPNKNSRLNTYVLYNALYAFSWHFAWFPTVVHLKAILGDRQCSQKLNSVSGHYYVHTYSLLTLLYITVGTRRPTLYTSNYYSFDFLKKVYNGQAKRKTILIVCMYSLAVVLSVITLFRTISYGFHSIRQSLYGVLMGLVVHLFLVLILDEVNLFNLRNNTEPTAWEYPEIVYYPGYARSYSSLLLLVSTMVSWYISFEYETFPYSAEEVLVGFPLMIALCLYEWYIRRKLIQKVQQTIKDEKHTFKKHKKEPTLAHYH
eukprot:TRINITY_DN14596_c0_g1_i1.p1 TRINITY_DN14596_c0_g1~~TRINITY_DN14596_c0_g1_i1.p1  ORF type:complete len:326 (-),score=42.10 TRINITY_DN14596_c0_g1_i1:44-1021(-)